MNKKTEELRMRIAKLNYQYAYLIGDKDIDRLWYELLNRERWFDSADQILQACKEAILAIENPYAQDIFPTSIEGAGKFLTEKGLTDKEKTAISGCIARLGWENCQRSILEEIDIEV